MIILFDVNAFREAGPWESLTDGNAVSSTPPRPPGFGYGSSVGFYNFLNLCLTENKVRLRLPGFSPSFYYKPSVWSLQTCFLQPFSFRPKESRWYRHVRVTSSVLIPEPHELWAAGTFRAPTVFKHVGPASLPRTCSVRHGLVGGDLQKAHRSLNFRAGSTHSAHL